MPRIREEVDYDAIINSIKYVDEHGVDPNHKCDTHFISYGNKQYDAKYVVAIADSSIGSSEINKASIDKSASRFNSNEALNLLKKLGFQTISKNDLSRESESNSKDKINYWWINANPNMWILDEFQIGGIQTYSLFNDNGNKRRVFNYFLEAKQGDFLVIYESSPNKKVVGLGRICKEQDGEEIGFEIVKKFNSPINLATIQQHPILSNIEYLKSPQGSLFKLSEKEYDCIINLAEEKTIFYRNDFSKVLIDSKNIIFHGAPGPGKTFPPRRPDITRRH